jgi:hypothetical protein
MQAANAVLLSGFNEPSGHLGCRFSEVIEDFSSPAFQPWEALFLIHQAARDARQSILPQKGELVLRALGWMKQRWRHLNR